MLEILEHLLYTVDSLKAMESSKTAIFKDYVRVISPYHAKP